jgi:glutaminyl-peptide cyclotransferase
MIGGARGAVRWTLALGALLCVAVALTACGGSGASTPAGNATASASSADASAAGSASGAPTATGAPSANAPATADDALPARQSGGFDGARAFQDVAKLVSFGPHPSGSDGIHQAQQYIEAELKSSGCAFEEDNFHTPTPIGDMAMENIVAKVPGSGSGIILLLTHYDTKRLDNFVGAEDSGSSTGVMLEMARLLCSRQGRDPNAVWIAFLDGEEAMVDWTDTDSVYGSRELAARMAMSGDLKRVKAVILADMIGQKNLEIPKETGSTKWLTDLVWSTATQLGYGKVFVTRDSPVEDDHQPFLKRGVPAVDLIDLDGYQAYWHTPQDTLDKISARNLGIVGHVVLASVAELQKKNH